MNIETLEYFPSAKEGDRLIAKFMGLNYHPKLEKVSNVNCLYYSQSWDWLIPVIEKISKTTIEWENSDDRTDTYYPRTFGMISEDGNYMVRLNGCPLFEAETLIEAAYLAVVNFVTERGGE